MTKRSVFLIGSIFPCAFAVCFLLSILFPKGTIVGGRADYAVTFFVGFLLLFWGVNIIYRVQSSVQRNILIAVITVMFLWMALRFSKWLILDEYVVKKYLDYAYSIPMTVIPVLVMAFNLESFFPGFKKKKFFYIVNAVIAAVLIVVAMTNDLHHGYYVYYRVIPFEDSDLLSVEEYKQGIVHHIVSVFVAVNLFAGFGLMLYSARKRLTARQIILPLLPLLLAVAYATLYFLRVPLVSEVFFFKDFTLISTILLYALLEIIFNVGLIQNNGRYARNFRESTLPMRICDENGRPLFSGKRFDEKRYEEGSEGTRIVKKKIGAYTVITEEDLSALLALQGKITAENKETEKKNELLDKALRIASERASLEYRLSLAEEIEKSIGVSRRLLREKVALLPDRIEEENAPGSKRTLGEIALLLGYMKQKCMLLLGAKERKALSKEAFSLLVNVTAHDVRSVGYREVGFTMLGQGEADFSFALFTNDFLNAVAKAYAFRDLDMFIMVNPVAKTCTAELGGRDLPVRSLDFPFAVSFSQSEDGTRITTEAP